MALVATSIKSLAGTLDMISPPAASTNLASISVRFPLAAVQPELQAAQL